MAPTLMREISNIKEKSDHESTRREVETSVLNIGIEYV